MSQKSWSKLAEKQWYFEQDMLRKLHCCIVALLQCCIVGHRSACKVAYWTDQSAPKFKHTLESQWSCTSLEKKFADLMKKKLLMWLIQLTILPNTPCIIIRTNLKANFGLLILTNLPLWKPKNLLRSGKRISRPFFWAYLQLPIFLCLGDIQRKNQRLQLVFCSSVFSLIIAK